MHKTEIDRWLTWSADADVDLRSGAASVLGSLAGARPDAFDALVRLAADAHWGVRLQTCAALFDLARSGRPMTDKQMTARKLLTALASDEHEYVRACAGGYLAKLPLT